MVEKICDLDDDLMMQYLEGEEPSIDDMKKALRKATCECTAVPVCCGSAYRNKGVQKLLDAIVEYMPAPTDIPPIEGVDEDGNDVVRHSSDEEPFSKIGDTHEGVLPWTGWNRSRKSITITENATGHLKSSQNELYHTEMVEKICDLDDDLMMQYLEGEEPSIDDMKKALRKATCECTAVPVCCGSAYRNKGVQKLLDAIVEYMPAPTDIPPIEGVDEDGNDVVRHSSDEEPFSALAFKIMTDPFVGKLAYFRVYSGTMNSGSYVLNATKNKKERVGRILQMHANKREELDKVYSGDIAAAIGFKFTSTGDTICDEQHPVILESMEFPEPVIELAIEPKTKASQGKLGESLAL